MFEERSISRDFLISLGIALVLSALVFNFDGSIFTQLYSKETISIAINTSISLLGVIATIMTLFSFFSEAFDKNRAILVLKARNQYLDIFQRYSDSIKVLLFCSGFLIVIQILPISTYVSANQYGPAIAGGAILFILLFGGYRVYRCFALFELLYSAIKAENEKTRKK